MSGDDGGASGSKAFCTSAAGTVVTLATTPSPAGLAVDATYAYWESGFSVERVPLCGGTPTTLATNEDLGGGLAVDSTAVFYFTSAHILKVPLAGGAPTVLAQGQGGPGAIAIDATNVYWTNTLGQGSVVTLPLDGGTPVTLVTGRSAPAGLAVDATSVYWAESSAEPTTGYAGAILKVPRAGGVVVTLASGQNAVGNLLLQGTSVYWHDGFPYGHEDVRTVSVDGGPVDVIAHDSEDFMAMATDATSLFVLTSVGSIETIPLTGGYPTQLFANPNPSRPGSDIVVDSTSVYWCAADAVLRLTPK